MNTDVKTCAVIGNAPSILEHEYGEEIDSHDIVIRCNRSLVDGYEKFVGSRTSFRLLNCHMFYEFYNKRIPDFNKVFSKIETTSFNDIIKPEEVLVLKDDMNCSDLLKRNSVVEELLRTQWNLDNQVCSMNLNQVTQQSGLSARASAGAVAIALCRACFPNAEVNCYGFSFYQDSKECSHYYESVAPKTLGHDYDSEREILLNMDMVNFK